MLCIAEFRYVNKKEKVKDKYICKKMQANKIEGLKPHQTNLNVADWLCNELL